MSDKGQETRERILAAAEPLILRQGFAGTSLDDILKATGLTKGAFFHHFDGKAALAKSLVERYARNDFDMFERFSREAEAESDDPLERTFIFLKRFEAFIEALPAPPPGCVFAVYTYESVQFDPSIHAFIADGFRHWSRIYEKRFDEVLARHTPRRPVTALDLAELIMSIVEGGFILSRSYNDPRFVARQSRGFRYYLELLFADRPTGS